MERFAFPVLGQISMVHQPGHRRRQRQRAIKFSLAALTLVLAFVGVLAFAFIRLNVNHQVAELAPEWEGRLSNVI